MPKYKSRLVNEKLVNWRKIRGLSHQEIADLMGVSRGTYSSYEQGRRNPQSAKLIFVLAKILDVDVYELQASFDEVVPAKKKKGNSFYDFNKDSQVIIEGSAK